MPVLMIGTQRSGSNLLRLMLNQIEQLAAPHPPHILQRLMPLQGCYGDLSSSEAFANLVDDVCRLVELNPVAWDGVTLDRQDVASRCRAHSTVAVFNAVYDILAETWGADTWICKSLSNVHYLDAMENYIEGAKYLYLYRDGRDVACSFRKAVVGEKHFYHIAKGWANAQQKAIDMRDKVSSDRFFSVSYEQLTGETEATLQRLCAFLGYEYTSKILEFNQSAEANRTAKSSSLWGNVTQGLMTDNTRKFLEKASAEDIRIFEAVAGKQLQALGYELTQLDPNETVQFSEAQVAAFSEENERLKAERKESMDAEDRERRERQAGLLAEIKSRQPALV